MATKYHDYNGYFAIPACVAGMEAFRKSAKQNKYSTTFRLYSGQRLKHEEIHIYRAKGTVLGIFKLFLYEYPSVNIQKSISYQTEEERDSRYYDDSIDEKLGGDKEVLG